jgi:hypothetical protein
VGDHVVQLTGDAGALLGHGSLGLGGTVVLGPDGPLLGIGERAAAMVDVLAEAQGTARMAPLNSADRAVGELCDRVAATKYAGTMTASATASIWSERRLGKRAPIVPNMMNSGNTTALSP